MRQMIAIPLAATIALTGCGPTFPTIDSAALREAVAAVQANTVEICQYLPTNESVVSILTASDILETAYQIATQICNAVTEAAPPPLVQNPRLGDEDQCPMVRGVCIEGRFIGGANKPEEGP